MLLGLFLVILGLAFLAQNLGWLPVGVWGIIWPVLIVALGISLLVKRSGRGCICCGAKKEGENK